MKIDIAVCDDNQVTAGNIEQMILAEQPMYADHLETHVFYSGERLRDALDCGHEYDIIFTDIEMYETSGIDVAEHIRGRLRNYSTVIIFTTRLKEKMQEAFYYGPSLFLHLVNARPDPEEFLKAFTYAMEKMMDATDFFLTSYGNESHRVPIKKIVYLESRLHNVHVHTCDKVYRTYSKLSDEEKKLGGMDFIRTHKSFIVNLAYVTAKTSTYLLTVYGTKIPVSESNIANVRVRYDEFTKRKAAWRIRGSIQE